MTSERIDESIPLDTVKEWIRNCGYKGSMPSTVREVWGLYNRLAKERKPTERQLDYLAYLGHTGAKPETMFDAGMLIDRLKFEFETQDSSWMEIPSGKSPEKHRKEWVKERHEEFKEQIEEDIAEAKADRDDDDSGLDEDDLDDFRLVGWKLDFHNKIGCAKKQELKDLIYLAQIQISDIIEHLPPFDECPLGCRGCELDRTLLNDIPVSGNQYNIRYVQWDSPKFRERVPKHIFKIFEGSESFAEPPQHPTANPFQQSVQTPTPGKRSILYVLFAFICRIVYFSVKKAVEFEREHKVFRRIVSKIVKVSKNLGTKFANTDNKPLIIVGVLAGVVLLVLIWLVFMMF